MVILAIAVRTAFQMERVFDPGRYDFAAGMDEYNYDRLAASRAAGRSFFPGVIYALPGYPALLELLYRPVGRAPGLVFYFQSLLGALSCGLLYLAGRKILGEGGGWGAGLILAFYGPALFYETRLLPTSAALLTSILALTWWLYLPRFRSPIFWAVGGGLLGLAGIFAPSNLLFALLLLIFLLPRQRSALFGRAAPVLLGALAVLLPFALRNSRLAGGPVFLTAHSGINFYLGHNPEAGGGFQTPLFLTPSATGIISDAREEAQRRTGKPLNPAAVSRFWFQEGLRHLAAAPGAGVRNGARKLRLIFSPQEYPDIGGETSAEVRFALFGIPLLPFSWILPPALLGLFLLPGRKTNRKILLLYLAAQILAILFFFHQGRARLLLVPAVAVLAAGGLGAIRRSLRERKIKRAAIQIGLIAVVAVVMQSDDPVEMRSETNLLVQQAQAAAQAGERTAARYLARQALLLHPGLGGANLVLGRIAAAEGDVVAAEDYYRQAAEREPGNPDPFLLLGLLFRENGAEDRARMAAEQALQRDPLSWRAHSLLADIYRARGREEQAYRRMRAAVALNPNSGRDRQNLARYYQAQGDRGLAKYHQTRAERLWAAAEQP